MDYWLHMQKVKVNVTSQLKDQVLSTFLSADHRTLRRNRKSEINDYCIPWPLRENTLPAEEQGRENGSGVQDAIALPS